MEFHIILLIFIINLFFNKISCFHKYSYFNPCTVIMNDNKSSISLSFTLLLSVQFFLYVIQLLISRLNELTPVTQIQFIYFVFI